ncbi:MAG: hypothetical protein RSC04_03350 [Bacteroidales bacterium]
MQDFSYRNLGSDAQNIIGQQKRKINRQRIIYLVLFWLFIFSVAAYIYNSIQWVTFEGTIKTSNQQITLMDDAYILNIEVKIGDTVHSGDTLFDYLYTQNLLTQKNNLSSQTWIDKEYKDIEQRIAVLNGNLQVLEEQIKVLQREIKIVEKQIFIGVSTKADLTKLTNELRSTQWKDKLLQQELVLEQTYFSKIAQQRGLAEMIRIPSEFTLHDLLQNDFMGYRYSYIAKYGGMVINITSLMGTNCYKQEPVMEIQPSDAYIMNLYVEALVRPNQMKYLKKGDKVEIVITNKDTYIGIVELLGYRTAEIPPNLQNPFEKDATAVLVRIKIQNPELLKPWELLSGLPVELRKKRF